MSTDSISHDRDEAECETAAPPHPQTSAARRIRLRLGYAWRNSANPVLATTRVRWDCRAWKALPSVVSTTGDTADDVVISYAGLDEGLVYVLDFTERQRGTERSASARRTKTVVRSSALRRPSALPDADIRLVGTSAARARRLHGPASLTMPLRVHFVIDCDAGIDAASGRISKGTRRDIQRAMRKHRWTLGTDSTPAWFHDFYDDMYLPTMRLRHGDHSRTEPRDSAYECLFRTGPLFYISMDGQRVGGALCRREPRTGVLTSRLVGVRDGAAELYYSSALKVMRYLMIEWACENHFPQLDLQGSEAFISKGTYQTKRRYGGRVVLPPNHFGGKRLWLQVRKDRPAVRDFLVANPIVTAEPDGRLGVVHFFDAERPPSELRGESPGIASHRRVDLDEFLARTGDPAASPTGRPSG